jgi:hypothetical protein
VVLPGACGLGHCRPGRCPQPRNQQTSPGATRVDIDDDRWTAPGRGGAKSYDATHAEPASENHLTVTPAPQRRDLILFDRTKLSIHRRSATRARQVATTSETNTSAVSSPSIPWCKSVVIVGALDAGTRLATAARGLPSCGPACGGADVSNSCVSGPGGALRRGWGGSRIVDTSLCGSLNGLKRGIAAKDRNAARRLAGRAALEWWTDLIGLARLHVGTYVR